METPARKVKCPGCGGESLFAPSNPYRPFCSAPCKNHDFGAWASERHRLPDENPVDDFGIVGDLPPPHLPQ
jgi:uncharacterized protein